MTTSSQQTVLTDAELACLLGVAQGRAPSAGEATALAAKGMLSGDDASGHTLTPAGHHAIHVDEPGMLPGIDE